MATAVQVESILGGLTDNSGEPLAAGRVYTYYAGSTSPVSLYTSANKSTFATNPLILDGHGKAQVWADGRYKFVVKDQYDVTQYTLDNLLYGFDDTISLWGGQSTGSANSHTVSVPSTVTAYANGQSVTFIASYSNTGATTLQFNALGAVSLVKGPSAVSLQDGDIRAGCLYTATYEAYSGSGRFRLNEYPTLADVQRSRFELATNVSGINTITAAVTPPISSYETGLVIRFKALSTTTGAVTVNINSLGAKAVQRYGVALVAGEIKADDIVELVYDGTQFQLVNAVPAPLFVDRTNNRVGIGTTTPSSPLTVVGSSTSLLLAPNNASTWAQTGLQIRNSGLADGSPNSIYMGVTGTQFNGVAYIDTNPAVGAAAASPLVLHTGGVERMRLDSNNNIAWGAGNSSGRIRAAYQGAGYYQTYTTISQNWNYGTNSADSAANGTAAISLAGGASGYSSISFLTNINNTVPVERMQIDSAGNVGIGEAPSTARLTVRSDVNGYGGIAVNNQGQRTEFTSYFNAGVDQFSSIQAMTTSGAMNRLVLQPFGGEVYINKAGVGVGGFGSYFSQAGISGYPALLINTKTAAGTVGALQNHHNGVYVGGINYSETATGFPTSSDYRLKENLTPISNALERLSQLKPYRFNFIVKPEETVDGFVAHEVQEVVPNAVEGKKDAVNEDGSIKVQSLDHSKLVPLLTAALQEIASKVEALERDKGA